MTEPTFNGKKSLEAAVERNEEDEFPRIPKDSIEFARFSYHVSSEGHSFRLECVRPKVESWSKSDEEGVARRLVHLFGSVFDEARAGGIQSKAAQGEAGSDLVEYFTIVGVSEPEREAGGHLRQ